MLPCAPSLLSSSEWLDCYFVVVIITMYPCWCFLPCCFSSLRFPHQLQVLSNKEAAFAVNGGSKYHLSGTSDSSRFSFLLTLLPFFMCQCLWGGQGWQTDFRNGTVYKRILFSLQGVFQKTTTTTGILIQIWHATIIRASEFRRKMSCVIDGH